MLELPRRFRPFLWASVPVLAVALVISACSGSLAQTEYNDVPILVAAEDEDPTYVKRTSDIFKRTILELKVPLRRYGFAVVDEESVAVDLGWTIQDRRNKLDLIDLAKDMASSDNASHRVRALVLFRVHAAHKPKSGRSKISVRIDGEIIDIVGNRGIDGFEIPRMEFPAPAECNKLCKSEIVGDRAREVAASLGLVLAKQLARYRDDSVGDGGRRVGSGEAVTGDGGSTGSGSGHGLITTYTVTLEKFDRIEALSIIGTMADEFPGYKHHDLVRQMPGFRKYGYTTSAKAHKLEEWLTILLDDMHFNVDKEIEFIIRGTDITLHKIVPTQDRPRSKDENQRFK